MAGGPQLSSLPNSPKVAQLDQALDQIGVTRSHHTIIFLILIGCLFDAFEQNAVGIVGLGMPEILSAGSAGIAIRVTGRRAAAARVVIYSGAGRKCLGVLRGRCGLNARMGGSHTGERCTMNPSDSAVAIIWNTIAQELSDLPDLEQATRIVFKLVLAALLGGLLGFEREASGKAAGLRTHMLVAMGAAMFLAIA